MIWLPYAFRSGIRDYMQRHARANAVADDLWAALAQASHAPVVEVANAWIRQSGYPVIRVESEGDRVRLSQERFFSEPGLTGEERWPVPLVLAWEDDGGRHGRAVLLREGTMEISLGARGPVKWFDANAGSTGFYRVAYSAEALERLGRHLSALQPAERIGLLADQWALVRAGRARIGDFLDLVLRFEGETDDAVLDELWGSWATWRPGWSTATTGSASAGWWSDSSGRDYGRWAGTRWPERATTTGSGGERCCGRWPGGPRAVGAGRGRARVDRVLTDSALPSTPSGGHRGGRLTARQGDGQLF
jgi:puromycin-sensitive aminopeptidase